MPNFRKDAPPRPQPNSTNHPINETQLARWALAGLVGVLEDGHRPPLDKDAVLTLLARLAYNEEALAHRLAARAYVRNAVWQYFRFFPPHEDWAFVRLVQQGDKPLGLLWTDTDERYHVDLLHISRWLPKRATSRGEERVQRLIRAAKEEVGERLASVRVCLFNEPKNAFEVEL
jgi:hypothetical protein